MTTVQLSELGALAEKVKSGETIEIRDGEEVVAMVVPEHKPTFEERIAKVLAEGTPPIPDWFFEERPPKFPGSVLEQLLHDRQSRDW